MIELHNILQYALTFYMYAIIGYILMSWFPGARESSFGQILGKIVEPYLEPFRKFIPPLGMIDFSPIVAIFALQFAKVGLSQLFQMLLF
ncbi:YggT family protein [Salinibacillus xinjiangensis]|uniref:YggT family protein n=1 Tax=Salinibacillus xinjiangensis TaxID=1229268 RepID=A0A6G1X3J6_9BACI|nr:YggT family protein [Salinibacillus xinjiangensis]MRG85476.1 YggT family protein [Salinibacillus xinjiangensis]